MGIGPLVWVDDYSLFLSSNDVQLLRASVYKHYQVHLSGRAWKFTRVLFVQPPSIEIQGMEEIREYFQKNGVVICMVLLYLELVVL